MRIFKNAIKNIFSKKKKKSSINILNLKPKHVEKTQAHFKIKKGDIMTSDSDMADILHKQHSSVFSPILSVDTYDNFTSQRI